MKCRRLAGYILGLMAGLTWTGTVLAGGVLPQLFGSKNNEEAERLQAAALVPLDQIPLIYRGKISHALARPTLYTRGLLETFEAQPDLYRWLLDNPDRAVIAWKRLGAKCVEIERRGENLFGWTDNQGSDMVWSAVHAGPNLRIWFAEGQVKPGTLFPMVPVQCVVILRHNILRQDQDGALLQHQADFFVQTDSKAATVVTRLLGPSIPKLAKQGAGQLQMFFGALAWYCQQHPGRVEMLLRPETKPAPGSSRGYSPFDPAGMIYPAEFSSQTPMSRE